jgi:hypothetical protein
MVVDVLVELLARACTEVPMMLASVVLIEMARVVLIEMARVVLIEMARVVLVGYEVVKG